MKISYLRLAKNKALRRQQRGATLIELVLVIAILGIVAAGATELLVQGFRAYILNKNIITAEWQGRVALERMARDLHAISSPPAINSAGTSSTQISFTDIYGNSISYQKNGAAQLLRNNQVIADGVQSLTFTYYTSASSGTTTTTVAAIRYIVATLGVTVGTASVSETLAVYPFNFTTPST